MSDISNCEEERDLPQQNYCLLTELCNAARKNDATSVAKSLGLRRRSSPSLHSPILQPGRNANISCKNLVSMDSSELIIKALLMSPSIYETPWLTAFEVLSDLQNSCRNPSPRTHKLIRIASLEIQTFIQQNVASWLNEERKLLLSFKSVPRQVQPFSSQESVSNLTPVDWMILLAKCTMSPLLKNYQEQHRNENFSIPESGWEPSLGIISSLVVLTKDLDSNLYHSVLDVLISPIDPSCLIPFLRLVVGLRCHLREKDWSFLRQLMESSLEDNPCRVSNDDLPLLLEFSLKLITELLHKFETVASSWRRIVLQIMSLASEDDSAFDCVESSIYSYIASLSAGTQRLLTSVLWKGDDAEEMKYPRWLKACMLLQVVDATCRSSSDLVSHMLNRSLPHNLSYKTRPNSAVSIGMFDDIFDLADCETESRLPDEVNGDQRENKLNTLLFRRLEYKGKGLFVGKSESHSALVNCTGSLVWQTISVGRSRPAKGSESIRVESWVNCSISVLETYHSSHRRAIMAVAALTTIFCEVPDQRSKLRELLIGSFAQLDCCSEKATDLAVLYSLILSTVSRSVPASQIGGIQGVENIVSVPMSLNLFIDVVDAIMNLPPGREKLLSVSRAHIDNLSGNNAYASFSTTMTPSNLMKCGLHGLVSLISIPDWTDVEEEAWNLLSDFIVEDQPSYTVTHRVWFFDHVRRHLTSQSMSTSSAEHLLRSCIARLLIFYDYSDENRFCFTPERVYYFNRANPDELVGIEDMIGLLGLTMDLLKFLAVDGGHSQVKNTISIVYNELLGEIDSKGFEMRSNRICVNLLSSVNNGQVSIFAIAIACLVAIGLEPHTILSRSSEILGPAIQDLKKLNADEERLNLQNRCRIRWDYVAIHRNKNMVPEMKQAVIHLRLQATDMLLDFIFGRRWKLVRLPYQTETLVQRLGNILTLRRHWKLEARSKSFAMSIMHYEIVADTSDYLLNIILPSIDELMYYDCSLGEMDNILSIVLDICELLQDSFEVVSDSRLRSLCLDNIRSLYLSLCEESKCSELVGRIEKQTLSTKTTKYEHRQQLFCLNSVKHEDDIDDFVRYLRRSILGVIISSVPLPTQTQGLFHAPGVPTPTITSGHSGTMYRLLASICKDMLFGLEGKSGGLTYELFDSLLDAAENLMNQLQSLGESCSITGKKSSTGAFDLNEVSSVLEEILGTTSFSQRYVHKKMFSLTAETLPALCRSISRKYLCCGSVLFRVEPLFNDRTPLAAAAFMQAVDVLQDFSEQGQSIWKVDHIKELEDDCSTCSGKPREYCSKKRTENVNDSCPDHETNRADSPIACKMQVLQIPDKKAWVWGLNSSLHAIAVFIEDFRASVQNRTLTVSNGSFMKQYIAARTTETHGVFKVLNYVLETLDREIGESGQTHFVRAVLLPFNIKGKLCCVLENAFTVLTKSLKVIQQLVRHVLSENTHESSLALVETLSYLGSWLSFSPSETLDIFHKVRRWHHHELLYSKDDAKQNGMPTGNNMIIFKLRRAELRMDESEVVLHKVLQLIHNNREKRNMNEDKLKSVLTKYIDFDLVQLLSIKSNQLTEGHVLTETQFGPVESEENKKKRKVTENMKRRLNKERRRRTLRSRNGVVDNWLQIDRVTGDEIVEDDAFADLEDFLVDG